MLCLLLSQTRRRSLRESVDRNKRAIGHIGKKVRRSYERANLHGASIPLILFSFLRASVYDQYVHGERVVFPSFDVNIKGLQLVFQ